MRPSRLVLVTGTGTEVGKTWVGAALLRAARERGLTVAARKPAQSFDPGTGPLDAEVLADASGESSAAVCPAQRTYPVALAPPMAAEALGRPVPSLEALATAVARSWPDRMVDLGLVEGAGGAASPLATDGDSVALARALGVDLVVLVGDPGLGIINSVRLTAAALAPLPVVVHLNRFDVGDDLHRRNRAWLAERDGFAVTVDVADLLRVAGGGAL